jgi:hypothetical protein
MSRQIKATKKRRSSQPDTADSVDRNPPAADRPEDADYAHNPDQADGQGPGSRSGQVKLDTPATLELGRPHQKRTTM